MMRRRKDLDDIADALDQGGDLVRPGAGDVQRDPLPCRQDAGCDHKDDKGDNMMIIINVAITIAFHVQTMLAELNPRVRRKLLVLDCRVSLGKASLGNRVIAMEMMTM